MDKYKFIKIALAIFIILSVIISLFPPFEFGNEKLKTQYERNINYKIVEKLPIKQYDFIFNSNEKYFILIYYNYQKTFYNTRELKKYQNEWNERKFSLAETSADSFYTSIFYLNHDSSINSHEISKIYNGYFHIQNQPIKKFGNKFDLSGMADLLEYESKYPKLTGLLKIYSKSGILEKDKLEKAEIAVNYYQKKDEFKKIKVPIGWYLEEIPKLDSIRKYEIYNIFSTSLLLT